MYVDSLALPIHPTSLDVQRKHPWEYAWHLSHHLFDNWIHLANGYSCQRTQSSHHHYSRVFLYLDGQQNNHTNVPPSPWQTHPCCGYSRERVSHDTKDLLLPYGKDNSFHPNICAIPHHDNIPFATSGVSCSC